MFILINKPKKMTSHDVIYKVRQITGEKKVGHAGTLDPNATGLLIVGVGRESTKKLGQIARNTKKTYVANIFLGETRDTDDVEGKILRKNDTVPKPEVVQKTLESFEGEQEQMPPKYSALKIKGKKAYELAREGKEVDLKKRIIIIHSIELREYQYPELSIETTVSSGTYIRALARDIGEKLGTGAYLKNLERTKIGDFDLNNAVDLEKLTVDNWRDFAFKID